MIPCTEMCIYQSDGCCGLTRAASRGAPEKSETRCVHYIERRRGAR
jgi:hypothetical protein